MRKSLKFILLLLIIFNCIPLQGQTITDKLTEINNHKIAIKAKLTSLGINMTGVTWSQIASKIPLVPGGSTFNRYVNTDQFTCFENIPTNSLVYVTGTPPTLSTYRIKKLPTGTTTPPSDAIAIGFVTSAASTGQPLAMTALWWKNVPFKQLTVTPPTMATTKTFDGNNTVTVSANGVVGNTSNLFTNITVTAAATFNDQYAGTGKPITVVYTLSGSDAGIYLKPVNYSTTGNINQKQLVVSAPTVTTTKTFDGNNTAASTMGTVSGYITGYTTVTTTKTSTYNDALAGTGKTITTSYAISGTHAANYIKPVNNTTTGTINKKQLTITAPTVTTTKTFDGTTTAASTIGTVSGLVTGYTTVTTTGVSNYDNVNAGSGKTITTVYTLSGTNAANYIKPVNNTIATGIINQKQLTITAPTLVTTKTFDGNTTATVSSTGTLSGAVSGYAVGVTAAANHSVATAGSTTITTVYTMTGSYTGNYIKPVNNTTSGTINTKQLTIASTGITTTKTFDGTDTATVTSAGTLGGLVTGYTTVTPACTATFNSVTAGTGKTITAVYSISGTHAANYVKPVNSTYTTSGIINPKQLTISGTAINNKTFDGTNTATVTSAGTLSGLVTGYTTVTPACTATFNTATVGTGKAITAAYSISGTHAANYIQPSNIYYVGNITPKQLTISGTVVTTTKIYDGTTTANVTTTGTLGGLVTGYTTVTPTCVANYDNADMGDNKTITAVYSISGTHAANYIKPVNSTYIGKIAYPLDLPLVAKTTFGTYYMPSWREIVDPNPPSVYYVYCGVYLNLRGLVAGEDFARLEIRLYDEFGNQKGINTTPLYDYGGLWGAGVYAHITDFVTKQPTIGSKYYIKCRYVGANSEYLSDTLTTSLFELTPELPSMIAHDPIYQSSTDVKMILIEPNDAHPLQFKGWNFEVSTSSNFSTVLCNKTYLIPAHTIGDGNLPEVNILEGTGVTLTNGTQYFVRGRYIYDPVVPSKFTEWKTYNFVTPGSSITYDWTVNNADSTVVRTTPTTSPVSIEAGTTQDVSWNIAAAYDSTRQFGYVVNSSVPSNTLNSSVNTDNGLFQFYWHSRPAAERLKTINTSINRPTSNGSITAYSIPAVETGNLQEVLFYRAHSYSAYLGQSPELDYMVTFPYYDGIVRGAHFKEGDTWSGYGDAFLEYVTYWMPGHPFNLEIYTDLWESNGINYWGACVMVGNGTTMTNKWLLPGVKNIKLLIKEGERVVIIAVYKSNSSQGGPSSSFDPVFNY